MDNKSRDVMSSNFLVSLWKHRHLILQLAHREIIGRYKGSILGLGWSLINPLLVLSVYTFVFSVVFKARWGVDTGETKYDYALLMFVGIIVHSFISELFSKSPTTIITNANYVTKIVFPLEVLTIVNVLSAIFHLAVNILVLVIAISFSNLAISWTIIFTPLTLLPLIIMALGIGWTLNSLGVYLRDIGQSIPIFTTALLFLSPVFYPVTSLPEKYRDLLNINPLTFIIEQTRIVCLHGELPDFYTLGQFLLGSIIFAWISYLFFSYARKGFSDVV